MIERRPRRRTDVLDDEKALEARVAAQVAKPFAPGPQDAPDLVHAHLPQRGTMIGGLDHHLVRAETSPRLQQRGRGFAQRAFNAQRRFAIRDDANAPPRPIRLPAVRTPREQLTPGNRLLPFAERTHVAVERAHGLRREVLRPPRAFRRNDRPNGRLLDRGGVQTWGNDCTRR